MARRIVDIKVKPLNGITYMVKLSKRVVETFNNVSKLVDNKSNYKSGRYQELTRNMFNSIIFSPTFDKYNMEIDLISNDHLLYGI